MISILKTKDAIHESYVGLGVIAASIWLTYIYIKNKNVLNVIEDDLLDSYEDSYLSVELELDPDRKLDFLRKFSFTIPGKISSKLIQGESLALVVNRPTLVYLKHKFGKYPIFKMLGQTEVKSFTLDEFYNSHKGLRGVFSSVLEKGLLKSNNPKVRANGTYLVYAIDALLYDLSSIVQKIIFTSKKINISYTSSI